jgi:predicted secreted protein
MKSFYQTKGTIILTSEELIFVYIDEESTEDDVKIQDNLFFFKKNKNYQKIFKKIELEAIKDI